MRLFAAALIAALPLVAAAQEAPAPAIEKIPRAGTPAVDPISAEIGARGIGATLARLAALPDPTPDERFARAGLAFLAGVEGAARLRAQISSPRDISLFLPPLSPVAPPGLERPLAPGALDAATRDFVAAMERCSAALADLPEGADPGFVLNFNDLWFDIDGDGQRGLREAATPLLRRMAGLGRARGSGDTPPIVRFDAADAAWLSAYAHVLAGIGEMALAFDLEPAIARARGTRERLQALKTQGGTSRFDAYDGYLDLFPILLETLSHQPDPAHTRAAAAHWRAMIADNRRFWALVAQETDNQAEWIPNDRQDSMLGFAFPPGLGTRWQAVLDDGAALLEGRRSIPFWRAKSVGIDLAAWLDAPAPLDLPGVVQGWALAPYFTAAPPIDAANWRQFVTLVGNRNGAFMAITLN